MAGAESKGSRRYDKENLLWQSTVAIKSDPRKLKAKAVSSVLAAVALAATFSGCYVGKATFQGEDMRMYPFFSTTAAPAPAD